MTSAVDAPLPAPFTAKRWLGWIAPPYVAAEYPFLLERWLPRMPDPQAMLAARAAVRLAAGAVDGALTGCGLWLLCRPLVGAAAAADTVVRRPS